MDKVVHFEIPYENEKRAFAFYADTFGWKISPAPSGIPYFMADTTEADERGMPKEPGAINGGMMKRDDTARFPILVIRVDDAEACLKKVEDAGGKTVVPVSKVGDFGLYARFKDTEGNVMGIWQDVK